jgi:hypothetical protein
VDCRLVAGVAIEAPRVAAGVYFDVDTLKRHAQPPSIKEAL